MNQTKQDLLDAATYIEDHGWAQNNLESPSGEVCLLGALYTIIYGSVKNSYHVDTVSIERESQVQYALKKIVGSSALATWNDDEFTTKELVIKTLKVAAESVD